MYIIYDFKQNKTVAMEGIPDDEKNYIIIQLVLTGISPLAVRKIFDNEFHPTRLKSSLNKEFGKINQLKNRGVLNQAQIDILYPKDGEYLFYIFVS